MPSIQLCAPDVHAHSPRVKTRRLDPEEIAFFERNRSPTVPVDREVLERARELIRCVADANLGQLPLGSNEAAEALLADLPGGG